MEESRPPQSALNLAGGHGTQETSAEDVRTCLELLLIDQLAALDGEPPSREKRR